MFDFNIFQDPDDYELMVLATRERMKESRLKCPDDCECPRCIDPDWNSA